jgi:peroxiredoxin
MQIKQKGNLMTIKTNDIKKGTKVKTAQLGALVSGIMADNKKGNTRLIIIFAEIDGTWKPVEHTEKQVNLRKQLKLMGF